VGQFTGKNMTDTVIHRVLMNNIIPKTRVFWLYFCQFV